MGFSPPNTGCQRSGLRARRISIVPKASSISVSISNTGPVDVAIDERISLPRRQTTMPAAAATTPAPTRIAGVSKRSTPVLANHHAGNTTTAGPSTRAAAYPRSGNCRSAGQTRGQARSPDSQTAANQARAAPAPPMGRSWNWLGQLACVCIRDTSAGVRSVRRVMASLGTTCMTPRRSTLPSCC